MPKETGRKELERLYRLEGNEDQSGEEEEELEGDVPVDDDEDVLKELSRVEREYDPARGGGFSSSEESSEEDDDDDDMVAEDELTFPDIQVDRKANVPMGEASSRLAVVNLDWDNIRAVDLMAVFSSFCPPNGRIKSVAVYPSQFGKERMEREETEGPPREIFQKSKARGEQAQSEDDENEDNDDDEKIKGSLLKEDKGEEFDSAELRHYQLERLRYYYAVLTLSSPETAKALYDATDGTEYLTTANFFDLRSIPDEVSFEDDRARDECSSIPDGYKPNNFVTDALQHSKVKLTWDADDGARKEVVKKAFSGSRADVEENDLQAYLGSDSSGEDEHTDVPANGLSNGDEPRKSKKEMERERVRAALGLSESDATSTSKLKKRAAGGPVGDMQITFTSGLSNADKPSSVFENEPIKEETTVEKYVRRERERKRRRKEKMKGRRDGQDDTAPEPPTITPDTQAHAKEDLGFGDPFFADPGTAPDPSSNAATKESRKAARLARRAEREAEEGAAAQSRAELSLLMVPDDALATDPRAHFSMPDIERAEKAEARAGKLRKKKHRTGMEDGALHQQQPGFEMDVADPRFAAALDSHEFAIDPTNPRFRATKGMRMLLEEGRRKRARREDGEEERGDDDEDDNDGKAGGRESRKKSRRAGMESMEQGGGQALPEQPEDWRKLVAKVKGKTEAGKATG